jgi:hypothetical protein
LVTKFDINVETAVEDKIQRIVLEKLNLEQKLAMQQEHIEMLEKTIENKICQSRRMQEVNQAHEMRYDSL